MYKIIITTILPLFLFAQSGVLTTIIDGDSAILKNGNKNTICHLGDLDALEMRVNKKLKREITKYNFLEKDFISAVFSRTKVFS